MTLTFASAITMILVLDVQNYKKLSESTYVHTKCILSLVLYVFEIWRENTSISKVTQICLETLTYLNSRSKRNHEYPLSRIIRIFYTAVRAKSIILAIKYDAYIINLTKLGYYYDLLKKHQNFRNPLNRWLFSLFCIYAYKIQDT